MSRRSWRGKNALLISPGSFMELIEMQVGGSPWSFRVPGDRLVSVAPQAPPRKSIGDVRAAVRHALEHPLRFDYPLRRAMTPDDRIALVIDERLPQLADLIVGTLEYLASIGIGSESVTLLSAPGSTSQDWIEDLPDDFADVRTEVHQPGDRKLLSYLAATKKGRRIYLNRTLVDADQIISISGRRYDALFGYAGCEGSLYPALGDDEARRAASDLLIVNVPSPHASGIRAEAAEVARLLGSPIFIQAIESAGEALAHICAGLIDSGADGVRLLDERWRFTIAEPVDVVLAAIGKAPSRQDFSALARAVACASRAVKEDGVIVILSDAEPVLGEGMERLQTCDGPEQALRMLNQTKPADRADVFQWVSAAEHARIYLASGIRPEMVEEMFATPILSPGEVQRLLDLGGTCLHLPEADKSLVVVE